jgi:hypothetical protein
MKHLILLSLFTLATFTVKSETAYNENYVDSKPYFASTHSSAPNIDRLYFSDLRKYRMGAREVPADLKKYDGQTIQIVGFMVPFDSIEKIDRFILLQAPFMGCFHVPPPQPNESLMINSGSTNVRYTYEPILITGKLTIEETYIDRYLVSLYTISATKIEEVNQDAAEMDGLPAGFHMFGEF